MHCFASGTRSAKHERHAMPSTPHHQQMRNKKRDLLFMAAQVREARAEDTAAMCNIMRYYVEHTVVSWRRVDQVPTASELADKHAHRSGPWLVMVDDDAVVGYCYAAPYRPGSAGWAKTLEVSVYVAHTHLGRGYGRRLLEKLVADARALGVEQLVSLISVDSDGARAGDEHSGAGRASVALHMVHQKTPVHTR